MDHDQVIDLGSSTSSSLKNQILIEAYNYMNNQISTQAITDHITSIYRTPAMTDDQLNHVLRRYVFAVTMKFDGLNFTGPRDNPGTYLDFFGAWFHRLMVASFGNNLGRKRELQLLCYAFVDFPGSKHWGGGNGSERFLNLVDRTRRFGRLEFLSSGVLHIHAIIAVRPGPGEACRDQMRTMNLHRSGLLLPNLMIEPYDPDPGSFEGMVDYFKKGSDMIGDYVKSDAYDLFPRYVQVAVRPTTVPKLRPKSIAIATSGT